MNKKAWIYIGFFVVLTAVFLFFVFKDHDFSKSKLGVISNVPDFSFVNQDGKTLTQNDIEDKVFVAEYFFYNLPWYLSEDECQHAPCIQ